MPSVGIRSLNAPALVLYPTAVPPVAVTFGSYTIEAASNAPVAEGQYPLVIISHGSGGSPLACRDLASALAKSGYIVALVEHPGDNRNDNSRSGSVGILVDRPMHVSQVIDALEREPFLTSHLRPGPVAVVGHSMGGYTALALAGGQPWTGPGQKLEVASDSRVQALVLLAPAASWFVPNDSLEKIRLPILLYSAEHDRITPRWQAQLVQDLVPDPALVTFKIVRNGGHFSFLSPFPASMRAPGFAPASDPPGFDRERFQEQLAAEIAQFLAEALKVRHG